MPNVCGCARHVAALLLFGWQPHHISSPPDIHIPYGRKFWRGIYFGGLAVLRAIRQYFIRQKLHSVMSSLLRNHSLCTSCS